MYVTKNKLILPKVSLPQQLPTSSQDPQAIIKGTNNTPSSNISNPSTSSVSNVFSNLLQNSTSHEPNFFPNNNKSVITSKIVDSLPQNFDVTDVAYYRLRVKEGMTDKQIFDLINQTFSPSADYTYPKTLKRQFRSKWLKDYPWLRYSPAYYGAFCLPCVLFGSKFPDKCGKIQNLFLQPFTKWNDATRSFNQHQSTKNGLHEFTSTVFNNFISQMLSKSQPINVLVNDQLQQKINKNREVLKSIVDTIILCGHTNSALRGDIGMMGNISLRQEAMLIKPGGNQLLKDQLESSAKNARYISKTVQNDLIGCCGQEITNEIISEVKLNKFYSIIADEACDSSTKEQMALILRYVDSTCEIKEDFIRFLHCSEGLSGADLFSTIMKCLKEDLGLDIMDCRGQGYDGAGSVSGHINGLSSHILRLNSKAIYTHCHSHKLNLTVCDSLDILLVSEVFDKVKELSYFFNLSETRQKVLQKFVVECKPDTSKSKLKDICRTRWVERIDGLEDFLKLYTTIVKCLKYMSSSDCMCNRDTKSKASSFVNLISRFDFLISLVCTTKVLLVTLPVTRNLQSKSIDILKGINLISALKKEVIDTRNSVDAFHNNVFSEAVAIANELDVTIKAPRICKTQIHRSNTPFDSVSDYFKRSVTIPLLDFLNTSISKRFQPETVAAYKGLALIPSHLFFLKSQGKDWKNEVQDFVTFYTSDFLSVNALQSELSLWEKYWEEYTDTLPDSISLAFKAVSFPGFENIKIALRILGTLPVTSCESERSFSALRRLKEYARSTMTNDRLNGLALLYIHQEIIPDKDKVIDRYALSNRWYYIILLSIVHFHLIDNCQEIVEHSCRDYGVTQLSFYPAFIFIHIKPFHCNIHYHLIGNCQEIVEHSCRDYGVTQLSFYPAFIFIHIKPFHCNIHYHLIENCQEIFIGFIYNNRNSARKRSNQTTLLKR
ncbi:52 kDa repressor of the inhibitor of the protein kinase-like [Hydractinia symbiolongicarpus]|uniref:52 kDa repressor of the inhibitor of the protein kinase-like n=1 Tax=Hydractinia symbiolongicarpus TaxID=13093 RepID=UPI00254D761B|nr:52 kDa repressor of the inhibitor of the protein kinase-like [Hydractinia symbiolongicarpus]